MAVDAVVAKTVVDFASALLVVADMGWLVVLDIVAVIALCFQHLNYYQSPVIQTKRLGSVYSTADFGPTNDTPLFVREAMSSDFDWDAVALNLHEVQAIVNICRVKMI